MKTALLILFLSASTGYCVAQDVLNNWCEKKEYIALRYYAGDTIRVTCDTIYLVHSAGYKLYRDVFKNHRTLNSDVKKLTNLYDYTKTLYENRIAEQNVAYDKLKNEFDGLIGKSQDLVRSTTLQLKDVDNSLSRLDKNILKAQEGISEAKKLITAEVKNSYKQKLKWGVGGFAVGITATAVIFALAK